MAKGNAQTAIYARISDAREGKTAGVDRQVKDCRQLCKARGWTVGEVWIDNDVSAMRFPLAKRPAGSELVAAIEAGKIDRVVVWHSSRLIRSRSDRVAMFALFRELGVSVIAVKGPELDLTSATGRMVANVLGEFDSYESELKGERIARASQELALKGKFAGGRRRLGYNRSATELVQPEADEIAWAYRHVAAGGSLEAVARRWQETIGSGTLGGELTGVKVRQVLQRPMNGGLSYWKGREVGQMHESVPRIIDEETWRTVNAILSDPSRRTTKGKPAVSLLAPVLRCAVCGDRMNATNRRHTDGTKSPIYRCRAGHVSRERHELDAAVSQAVIEHLSANATALRQPMSSGENGSAAAKEAEQLRARLDALAQLVADGDLDPADYAMSSRSIRERLATVEHRLVQVSTRPATVALLQSDNVATAWDQSSTDERRTVIKEVIDRVVVSHGKARDVEGVEIVWRFGG